MTDPACGVISTLYDFAMNSSHPSDSIDGSTGGEQEKREISLQPPPQQPCILNAVYATVPAAVLGWFFGLLPSMFRNRSLAMRQTWLTDANLSAQNLAKFSGTYSFAHCIISRLRQVDDALNRGVAGKAALMGEGAWFDRALALAGCVTGLAIGWPGGPAAAMQSCIGIGMISYIVDMGGGSELPANAAACCSGCRFSSHACSSGSQGQHHHHSSSAASAHKHGPGSGAARRRQSPVGGMPPPVMWLGAMCEMSGSGRGYFGDAAKSLEEQMLLASPAMTLLRLGQ